MNIKQNIITSNIITLIGFLLLIIISFITAQNDIKQTVQINLESVNKAVYESSLLYSKYNSQNFKNEDFKNYIKNVKIAEKGYIYFLDKKGNILIHPTLEGKNLANEPFFKEMISNKEGYLTYKYENQTKYIFYRYLPFWDQILISTIDENDFLDDIFNHFLQNIVLLGIIFILIISTLSYKVLKMLDNNIKKFSNYFAEFLNFITLKQNVLSKVKTENNNEFSIMINQINSVVDEFDNKFKNDMRVIGEIVLTMDKLQQGIFRCRINSDTNNPMIKTLRNTINSTLESLELSMKELQKVVTSYTHNDFTDKIEIPSKMKARLLAVMEGVNILGETLGNVAKQNLNTGLTLENNASIMKTSMHNLAIKANEQASSLEETAASVEEITSLTRNNTQNATKMTALGETVKSAVFEGQNLASKTAISMEEIHEKVNAIHEAITVIDQIAFQTNILSLNAAVEAATAGEAGRGFAVVAAEVRNLANKSASAAQEIKHLVEIANHKAYEGKNISDEMINGYEILNNHISETINIIKEVSFAAKEQMNGIEQINDTISMLDKVTQENANNANQITTIATEVSKMAQNLVHDAKTKKFN